MAGPIQTLPQGLLGLLQLKQTGQNPNTLLEVVQPGLDLREFYMKRVMQNEIGLFGYTPQTAALTTGQHGYAVLSQGGAGTVLPIVPQNQTWYIDQASLYIVGNTIAAADTLSAGVLVGFGAGGSPGGYLLGDMRADVITARARSWAPPMMNRPVFIPPGSQFFAWVGDILTATSITLQLVLQGAALPI